MGNEEDTIFIVSMTNTKDDKNIRWRMNTEFVTDVTDPILEAIKNK